MWGSLAWLLRDPNLTDIFVNGGDGVFVDRGSGIEKIAGLGCDAAWADALGRGLVAAGGRHVDDAHPVVDVRLGDGMRVHVALAPIATRGTTVSIRVPRSTPLSLDDLEGRGMLTPDARRTIDSLVAERRNVLIAGAGGAGKTTLLSAMLGAVPSDERIVVVEDVAEIRAEHPHVVSLETRQASVEGRGEVTLADLVRAALRMRPDRLVLGECRGAEVREMMLALATGHDGGAGTLHARSIDEVPARLEALGALAGFSAAALARQAASAFDALLFVSRRGGIRRLDGVAELGISGDRLVVR